MTQVLFTEFSGDNHPKRISFTPQCKMKITTNLKQGYTSNKISDLGLFFFFQPHWGNLPTM